MPHLSKICVALGNVANVQTKTKLRTAGSLHLTIQIVIHSIMYSRQYPRHITIQLDIYCLP